MDNDKTQRCCPCNKNCVEFLYNVRCFYSCRTFLNSGLLTEDHLTDWGGSQSTCMSSFGMCAVSLCKLSYNSVSCSVPGIRRASLEYPHYRQRCCAGRVFVELLGCLFKASKKSITMSMQLFRLTSVRILRLFSNTPPKKDWLCFRALHDTIDPRSRGF